MVGVLQVWVRAIQLLIAHNEGDFNLFETYITAQWKKADTDRSGTLTRDEVRQVLMNMNITFNKTWFQEKFDVFDVDKSLTMDQVEFAQFSRLLLHFFPLPCFFGFVLVLGVLVCFCVLVVCCVLVWSWELAVPARHGGCKNPEATGADDGPWEWAAKSGRKTLGGLQAACPGPWKDSKDDTGYICMPGPDLGRTDGHRCTQTPLQRSTRGSANYEEYHESNSHPFRRIGSSQYTPEEGCFCARSDSASVA